VMSSVIVVDNVVTDCVLSGTDRELTVDWEDGSLIDEVVTVLLVEESTGAVKVGLGVRVDATRSRQTLPAIAPTATLTHPLRGACPLKSAYTKSPPQW
jgi:hypothetical protein